MLKPRLPGGSCWQPTLLEHRSESSSESTPDAVVALYLDDKSGNCDRNHLKALYAICYGTYDFKQMGRKRVLKAERHVQLHIDDVLKGTQLALLPQISPYQIVNPRSEGSVAMRRKSRITEDSRRKHRVPGNASGWIEERTGNRKRRILV